MSHPLTSRRANLIGGVLAGGIAIALCVAGSIELLTWSAVGALAGAGGGWMQMLARRDSGAQVGAASTAVEVRRAFASTSWGRRYLYFFWAYALLLGIGAVLLHGTTPLALQCWFAGSAAFVALRELACFIMKGSDQRPPLA